jgi:CheY-like chemotaxis protein
MYQEPCTLMFATNGREASALFSRHHPSVVVTDWTMPDFSGLDLCRLIRNEHPDVYSHLILLTSNSNKGEWRSQRNHGRLLDQFYQRGSCVGCPRVIMSGIGAPTSIKQYQ